VKRRLFLKGVGGAALAAPFLSSLERSAHGQEATEPRRLVVFYTQNGCLTNRWFPTVEDGPISADSLAGTTLAGLSPFADKLLFPRGLALYPAYFRGQNVDPHDQAMGSKLTCAPIAEEGDRWAQSHSLDHEIAQLINPGTKSPLVLTPGSSFSNVKGIVSYVGADEPYAPVSSPKTVYSTLTGLFQDGAPTEADFRVKRGESIIDLVKSDLDAFKSLNMSGADQQKVDDWLELLFQTEQQVIPAECNDDTASSALGVSQETVDAANGGFGSDLEFQLVTTGAMMMKLVALTMMCDANRSIIYQMPGFVKYNFLNNTQAAEYDHHGLSHRNGSAAVGGTCVSGVLDAISAIDAFLASQYVNLVTLLGQVQEGDKTLLDNSAVMWLPELADGNAHNTNNLPIVIAGSAGGYLKTGAAVNLAGGSLGTGNSEASCGSDTEVGFNTGSNGGMVPLNKLYVTLMNAVGCKNTDGSEITSFGVVDTEDLAAGITDPGELSALRANA
jgi:hypothetical protein